MGWLIGLLASAALPGIVAAGTVNEAAENETADSKTTAQAETANPNDSWGDWDDNSSPVQIAPSPWQWSGFAETAIGFFNQDNIVSSARSLTDFRLRLAVDYSHEKFEFSAKADLLSDQVLHRNQLKFREFNFAASPIANVDIKIGRQILTWGTGDYLFLNDLFAKDWQSFFSGRDDQYLKAPSDSLRVSSYLADFTLDLVWTPEFTPDNYLTGERFSFYSPAVRQIIAPAEQFKVNQSHNDQWSLRLSRNINSVEYALYGYRGNFNTPQGVNHNGEAFFPKLSAFGGSLRMPLGGGLFNTELAIYHSRQDRDGSNPLIANSQQRLLLGYEIELIKNLTAAGQIYIEKTDDYPAFKRYDPNPNQRVDEYRQLLTLRLTYRLMQQKLTLSLFSFYSPTDHDSYLRPSINYRMNDRWTFAAGANLFAGRQNYSFFGQHEDNSNSWLRINYYF